MPLLDELNAVLKEHEKHVAVISYDHEKGYTHFTYKNLVEWCSSLCHHIQEYITEKHTCVGLLMTHNALIPSLVIRLDCS